MALQKASRHNSPLRLHHALHNLRNPEEVYWLDVHLLQVKHQQSVEHLHAGQTVSGKRQRGITWQPVFRSGLLRRVANTLSTSSDAKSCGCSMQQSNTLHYLLPFASVERLQWVALEEAQARGACKLRFPCAVELGFHLGLRNDGQAQPPFEA